MTQHYLFYGSERYTLAIMRPVQEAIRARGEKVAWFFGGPGAEHLHGDELLLTTVDEVKAWNPIAVITPNNMVPHFFPGVKVQTFHGFDAGKPRHIYIRGLFDLYCTTGPQDTAQFNQLAQRLKYFRVTETGWPKLDPFFRHFQPTVKSAGEKATVLYHSTFSPSWSAAELLYPEVKRLSQSGEWRWVVTLHPKMNKETVAKYRALESDHLRFATNDNILDLFNEADVMCSDTSSALSEFLLTGKPVVTFKNRRPGPQLIDIDRVDDFEPSIRKALAAPPELVAAIQHFGEQIHPYQDGHSAERILKAIDDFIASDRSDLRKKPWNLLRKYKICKQLKHWEF